MPVDGVQPTTESLHIFDFLIKDMLVLTFGNTVANKKDALRELAAKLTDPLVHHLAQKLVDVLRGDDFNAVAIRVALGGIAGEVLVHGAGDSGHRATLAARRSVRHISGDDHGGNLLIIFDRNPRKDVAVSTACAATEFRVHLHADV